MDADTGANRMTQDSESLKPCPFCGGRAAVEVDNEEWEIARVLCIDCGAGGPYEDLVEHASEAEAMKKACDRWNARLAAAPSTSVREEVEDLFNDALIEHGAQGYGRDRPSQIEFTRVVSDLRRQVLAALVPSTDEGKRHG